MRRDLCRTYNADIEQVYDAYVRVIRSALNKDCTCTRFSQIQFSLSFSFKYNMNGGACTIHFMRYNNGTAVDCRYSLAQAFGARYGAHEQFMASNVQQILGVPANKATIDVNMFLNPANQVMDTSASEPQSLLAFSHAGPVESQEAPQVAQAQPNTPMNAQPLIQPIPQPAVQAQPLIQPIPQPAVQAQPISQPAPQAQISNPQNGIPAFTVKFCGRCGSKFLNDAAFCSHCGAPRPNM